MIMQTDKAIALLPPTGGETLDVLGAAMIVKRADGEVFLADHVVPPGYFVPPHTHEHDEEIFYILSGRLTLLDGAGERVAEPGETVTFARGVLHGFRNDTDADVRFLVVCTPGLQAAEMFRHLDRAAPREPAAVGEICAQYGVAMG